MKSYSSVDEYLKNLKLLEVRVFTCPKCEHEHSEFIYVRSDRTNITCQGCNSYFYFIRKPPQLLGGDGKVFPVSHYKIDNNFF